MNRFKNILYVLNDQVEEASASLMRAVSLAKNNQADLTLLRVLPKLSLSTCSKEIGIDKQKINKTILEREHYNLHQLTTSLDSAFQAKTELRMGKKYIETIRSVKENNFDLVVKEVDSFSWLDRFLGSDDMHLLRKCPCSVWLMKKNEKPDYDNIMATVDFDTEDNDSNNDELNIMIMDLVSSLSLSDFAAMHVVNVYDVIHGEFISMWVEQPDKVERELNESEYRLRRYKMDKLFDDLKHRIGEESYKYLSPSPRIVKGVPDRELPKVATSIKADLVVMGTVARTGIAGFVIGNTAENVLSQLQCSVLAIKPKDFVSPIN